MTVTELAALIRGLAPVIHEHVTKATESVRPTIDGLVSRVIAIEQRAPKDGRDGKDGLNGKDGRDGQHGRDGFGFDDLDVVEEDGRQFLRFQRGDQVQQFRLYTFSDRGIYRPGVIYQKGDGVTFGGSLFLVQRETNGVEKPEDKSGAFRLAVKRGRDGDTGPAGPKGLDGKDGAPGRDLTQMNFKGEKY